VDQGVEHIIKGENRASTWEWPPKQNGVPHFHSIWAGSKEVDVIFRGAVTHCTKEVILMEETVKAHLSGRTMENKNPGDESMTGDGGFRPYHSVPCDLGTSHEPFVATVDLVNILTLELPIVWGVASSFEEFLHCADLFPCPAAVDGGE